MKKFLLNIYEKTQKLTFIQGVAVTICLTSVVSIAASNLVNGFFVFSPNTPISASEINANFEKIGGKIVLKANFSSSFTVDHTTFAIPSDCPGCGNQNRKRLKFDTVSVGTVQTPTDNDANSTSNGSQFSTYTIPETGWYESRLVANSFVDLNGSICDYSNCTINGNASLSVSVADTLAQASSNSVNSIAWSGTNQDKRDNNYDGVFDSIQPYPASFPEARRHYLKAGQLIFVKFDGSYQATSVTTNLSMGVNSFDLTIIKL